MMVSAVNGDAPRPKRHYQTRHSGMVRKHQTRNLEIPGSMLRIAPE
jgi:D-alanyl-D-alanine dipeptidase